MNEPMWNIVQNKPTKLIHCNAHMVYSTSSPEIADQLLEVMGPVAEQTLARGANLNIKFEVLRAKWYRKPKI